MATLIASNDFAAVGAGTAIKRQGQFALSLSGTFSATIALERTLDGTNWRMVEQYTAPVEKTIEEPLVGVQYRLNCTAYTSGTAKGEFYR